MISVQPEENIIFQNMNSDLLVYTFTKLSLGDTCRLRGVCKMWNQIMEMDLAWMIKIREHYGLPKGFNLEAGSYKELYKKFYFLKKTAIHLCSGDRPPNPTCISISQTAKHIFFGFDDGCVLKASADLLKWSFFTNEKLPKDIAYISAPLEPYLPDNEEQKMTQLQTSALKRGNQSTALSTSSTTSSTLEDPSQHSLTLNGDIIYASPDQTVLTLITKKDERKETQILCPLSCLESYIDPKTNKMLIFGGKDDDGEDDEGYPIFCWEFSPTDLSPFKKITLFSDTDYFDLNAKHQMHVHAISAIDNRLISLGDDLWLKIWDIEQGTCLKQAYLPLWDLKDNIMVQNEASDPKKSYFAPMSFVIVDDLLTVFYPKSFYILNFPTLTTLAQIPLTGLAQFPEDGFFDTAFFCTDTGFRPLMLKPALENLKRFIESKNAQNKKPKTSG